MRCVSNGKSHERTTAWCVSPKRGDLGCAMVRSGFALKWDKFWRDHLCQ
jgi:endonuclease YncB( thermonuclease family)